MVQIKIGVFCPTLSVYGGGEYVAIAIANTLAQNDHQVILFTSKAVNAKEIKTFFGETLHPSIENLAQPTRFASRELADFYQTIIHAYIAKTKCDTFIDAFSNCVYPWTDISYIHFPYLNLDAFSRNFPYLEKPRIMQAGTMPHVLLEKNLIDYGKRLVLANSHYTADQIKKYQNKNVEVIYPPFASSIAAIGSDINKNASENLVVTTSRFEYNKLLERIPQIAAQTNSSIKFVVIGRLTNQEVLISLQRLTKKLGVADRVKFYPNASVEQKIELLKRAKIYLHTMVGEHFGISIVEAMALGCLPIVHDSGGMREFVPQQYRYNNLKEAATKIENEINGWSSARTFEMKEISERFSIANFSARFMQLFSQYYN